MTRGFVVITDGKNITKAMYNNADSYLSGLGVLVLEAMKHRRISEFIDEKAEPEDAEMIEGISMDWIIKTEANKNEFFQDYAYVYNEKKDTLTVYNYGDLAFKITRDDIPVCEYVFEHDNDLYDRWAFDKNRLEYVEDTYKKFRSMLRSHAALSDYEALVATKVDSFYLEHGREVEHYGSKDYYKRVVDIDTNKKLKFYCQASTYYSDEKTIYLLTPFGRVHLAYSSTSNGADMKIKKYCREKRTELLNALRIMEFFDEYKESMSKYVFIKRNFDTVSEHSMQELERIVNEIMEFKSANPTLGLSRYDSNYFRKALETERQKMLKSEDKVEKKE